MRNTFVKELLVQSKLNKDIYLITSDLGFRSFEPFKKEFPDRFINVGVSENNMIGISAGMALKGKKVFVYSILPFLIFRSLEQIRNNVCHNNCLTILYARKIKICHKLCNTFKITLRILSDDKKLGI